ncbi:potassium channel family protein [Hoyosella subflava]|uniref:Ion transport 2 domain protein n=1 Tax=Hoyosella subflava (strain DSM 45089 / JCM 17490 / NBRC 109087 / DQS3-9A1) TaxID=443218 RepID=F6EPX4_HOYSD|nr:ion channel [Hoyosella subflava]AEF41795.1 Ion transport 2 domain protein [Hoyosella subflava DQS3-9A1]
MDWAITAVGALLVSTVLWDIFHTLWHTSGQGRIAHVVLLAVWKATAALGGRGRRLSGPLAMFGVIGTWGALVVLGWALIYYPHMPDSFSYEVGLDPDRPAQVLDALYMSLVTLATLGYGDIVPTAEWLRIVTPIQALVGFALLTAAVSWVLQVYPALSRRRVLALRLEMLAAGGLADSLNEMHACTAARVLDEIAGGLAQVRIDLDQYAETYYFRDGGAQSTLATKLDFVASLAREAQRAELADVRISGRVLEDALDRLADLIDHRFVQSGADTAAVLDIYAAQQRV